MSLSDILTNETGPKKMRQPPEKIILGSTRDNIHLQLMTKVRLNRYDMKFMSNINEKYIVPNKPLSLGQNDLYEKIVHKYRKQLKKLGVNYKNVLALPWENGIVDPSVLNQQTYFRIVDNDGTPEMQLYFNFNKRLIEDVRSLVHDDNAQNLNRGYQSNFGNGQKFKFEWNNGKKVWYGPFNLYLFKTLYDFAVTNNVRIEDSVTDLITALDAQGTKEEWTPGIRIVHGRMYINMIAETMLPYLEDIDMTDTSPRNVENLTDLGLAAPAEYSDIAEYLNRRGTEDRILITDEEDVAVLRKYVEQTNRNVIFHIGEILNNDKYKSVKSLTECESWDTRNLFMNAPTYQSYRDRGPSVNVDNFTALGYNTLITTTTLANLLRTQSQVGKFALEADKIIYISIQLT